MRASPDWHGSWSWSICGSNPCGCWFSPFIYSPPKPKLPLKKIRSRNKTLHYIFIASPPNDHAMIGLQYLVVKSKLGERYCASSGCLDMGLLWGSTDWGSDTHRSVYLSMSVWCLTSIIFADWPKYQCTQTYNRIFHMVEIENRCVALIEPIFIPLPPRPAKVTAENESVVIVDRDPSLHIYIYPFCTWEDIRGSIVRINRDPYYYKATEIQMQN